MHPQNSIILSLFIFYLVATTHANDDQVFECVDVYKQPSLQHPLLKNHKLQITSKRRSTICPTGMVPIHKFRNKVNNNFAGDTTNWATLDTTSVIEIYHGASAVISINNPTLISGKVSRAQIMIESGSPHGINSIIFGWAIDPEFYGDNLTHFSTYWTSDGFQTTGCYNTVCKGFIQDFSELYPGKPLDQISTYGGQQVDLNLSIVRDGATGNWMLMNYGALVGYWPKEIFTNLGSGANLIRYGGVVAGGAPMGNGNFPDNGGNDLSKSSYFKEMGFTDANFQNHAINELEMIVNAPKPNCYKLNYFKDQLTITYGGPGGSCPNY